MTLWKRFKKNNVGIPSVYASKNITKYILRECGKRFVKSESLNIKCIPNGIIAIGRTAYSFGVFDEKGVYVKESMLLRCKRMGNSIPTASTMINPQYLDCDAVYLGDLGNPSFGHYILENWNRAYAFCDEKYRKMKFVLVNDMRIESIPNFVAELARLLGISPENFIFLNESTRFRNVYVPEQGFMMAQFSTKEFGKIYAQIAEKVKEKTVFEKIYMSRAALKHRKTYGEEKVQGIFEKNGYRIVYPEQLPLEEQIALVKNCKSLAGCAGTALHLALFMPNGGNVIQLKRNKRKSDNCGVQYLITQAKGIDLVVIEASIEKYKTKHFDKYPQIIGVTEHLKRFFDDNGFTYSSEDIDYDRQSYEEYIRANEDFLTNLGRSRLERRLQELIVQAMACFIPSRLHRNAFRGKMRKLFGIV